MLRPMMAFAPGSVSVRLYPHNDLPAPAIVEELRRQAAVASTNGFDGVMTSEHHGGFGGYLPNPLQQAGWLLEAMPEGWAAACPLLLPLRPPALVAEEVAWLAARFPDRVGIGVAAGALNGDFEAMGQTMDDLAERFATGLAALAQMLSGSDLRGLGGDPALARCIDHPVPVLSAAMGLTAARRAAQCGVGLIFDSLSSPQRCRELSDAYREAGGEGTCVLIRRAWLGDPPRNLLDRQVDTYRSYSTSAAQSRWGTDEVIGDTDPQAIAERAADAARRAGADAINIRVHVPGLTPEVVRDQIGRLGDAVVPDLRTRLLGGLRL
jgi:alkanesulfonate monooxygenase SsuD/methylene tetrahydromethanopterin reductase-like flavin-dependent oxidoreductase (luciferase family)